MRKGKCAIYGVFYGRFSGSKNHTIKLRTAKVRYHLGTHIIRLESRPSGQFNHKFSLGGAEKRTTVRFLRALSRGCYPRALREMLPCDAKDAVRRHRRCVSSPLLECRPRDKTHSPPRSLARSQTAAHKAQRTRSLLMPRLFAFNLAKSSKKENRLLLAAAAAAGAECSSPFCPIYGTDIRNTLLSRLV